MKSIYPLLIAGFILAACAKRPTETKTLPYAGNEISVEEAYFQKEVRGEKSDSSFSFLHLQISIMDGAKPELDYLEFEGVKYDLNQNELSYRFKIPSNIDLMNKKMKYVSLYFSLDDQEYMLMEATSAKEPLFLP